MTWFGLVRKNLLRRPMRTLLTSAGVALGVGLIVALLSISAGVERTAGDLIHLGRADFGLFQSGVSDATRSLLPTGLEAQVARDPGVAATARIFLYVTTVQGHQSSLVFGLAPDEFPARRLTLLSGNRSGALVGDAGAKAFGVRPGSSIPRRREVVRRLGRLPQRRPLRGPGRRPAADRACRSSRSGRER